VLLISVLLAGISTVFFYYRFGLEEKFLVWKGNRSFNKAEYGDAEVYYKKAISVNPMLYWARYNLANALYQQDRYQEAILFYKQAIQAEGHISEAWNNLGNTYFKKGELSNSLDAYKTALLLKSDDTIIRQNYLVTLKQIQKPKKDTKSENVQNEQARTGDNQKGDKSADQSLNQEQKFSEKSVKDLMKQLALQEEAAQARIGKEKQKTSLEPNEFDY